jgi:hypothetical protein
MPDVFPARGMAPQFHSASIRRQWSLRACSQISIPGSHPVFTQSLTGLQSQNPRHSPAMPAVLFNQSGQILRKSGRDPL